MNIEEQLTMKKLLLGAATVAVLSTTMIGGAAQSADAAAKPAVEQGQRTYEGLKSELQKLIDQKSKYLNVVLHNGMPVSMQTQVNSAVRQAEHAVKSGNSAKLHAAYNRLTAIYKQLGTVEEEDFDHSALNGVEALVEEYSYLKQQRSHTFYERDLLASVQRAEQLIAAKEYTDSYEFENMYRELEQKAAQMKAYVTYQAR